jgi:hypothetical protein
MGSVALVYRGHCFSVQRGSLQVVTCAGQALLDEYQRDFADFLAALVMN